MNKRIIKGFLGLIFMLIGVVYVGLIVIMTINKQRIEFSTVATISVGFVFAFGFYMFVDAIINNDFLI